MSSQYSSLLYIQTHLKMAQNNLKLQNKRQSYQILRNIAINIVTRCKIWVLLAIANNLKNTELISSVSTESLTLIHLNLYRYSYQLTCVPLPSEVQHSVSITNGAQAPPPPLRSGQMSRVLLFSDPCVRYEGEGGGGHIHKLYIIAYWWLHRNIFAILA